MATMEELRQQYYADLLKSGQNLVSNLPQLPKETVEGISGAEQQALDLARQSISQRPKEGLEDLTTALPEEETKWIPEWPLAVYPF